MVIERIQKWNYALVTEKIYALTAIMQNVHLWVKKKLIVRNGLVTDQIKQLIIAIDVHLLIDLLTL